MRRGLVKEQPVTYHWAGFGFLPAMRAGLDDGLHPGSLTAALLFFMFIYFVVQRGYRPLLAGIVFLLVHGLFSVWIGIGSLDWFMANRYFNWFLDIAYLLIIISCLLLGGIFFRDWWILRIKKKPAGILIPIPFVDSPDDSAAPSTRAAVRPVFLMRVFKFVCRMLFCAVGGILVALIASAWPSDTFLMFILYLFSLPGKMQAGVISLVIYGFSFILPTLAVFLLSLYLVKQSKKITNISRYVSQTRVMLAAVFLAYGISLLMYYF